MDIEYFKKIQGAYGTNNKREKQLAKTNRLVTKHFDDTYSTETVVINGSEEIQMMIVHDTDANTHKRKFKTEHQNPLNLGDYVEWNGNHWIVYALDVDDKTWNRGYIYLCTIPLRWQNSAGEIVERWAYSEDFTKYSGGDTGNNVMKLGDNQYGITVRADIDTINIKRGTRFVIDYDGAEQPDTYAMTNRKTALADYSHIGRGGTILFTFSFRSFNKDTDVKVELDDGRNVWICDYVPPLTPLPTTEPVEDFHFKAKIYGNSRIKLGYPRTYRAEIVDSNGNPVGANLDWNVKCDKPITYSVNSSNEIVISVDNENYVGLSIVLQAVVDKAVVTEMLLSVVEPF